MTRLHYRAEPLLRRALREQAIAGEAPATEAILAGPKRPPAEDLRSLTCHRRAGAHRHTGGAAQLEKLAGDARVAGDAGGTSGPATPESPRRLGKGEIIAMSRACSLGFGLVALLASVAAVHGEDAKKPRTDLYGDPLPPGAVAALGTIRLRHRHAQIAFSKDGKQLVSCDQQGEVRIWDAATGKQLGRTRLPLSADTTSFRGVSLSPVGTLAAAWNQNGVELFDTRTGKKHGRITTLLGRYSFLTFSPDGKFLAVHSDARGHEGITEIWDVVAVKKRQTLNAASDVGLREIAFSLDGKKLAGLARRRANANRYDLFLWETASGKVILKSSEYSSSKDLRWLAFSPDGKTLAVGVNSNYGLFEIRLLAVADLKERASLASPLPSTKTRFSLDHLTYSPDGRSLAAAYTAIHQDQETENGVFLWEVQESTNRRRLPARRGISRLVFTADSKTLACSYTEGEEIRLWNAATGRTLHPRPGHDLPVHVLAASPDGKAIASGDLGPMLRLWDATTGEQSGLLKDSPRRFEDIWYCLFSSDGKRVMSLGNHAATLPPRERVQLWDAAAGKLVRRFESDEGDFQTFAAAITSDGSRLIEVFSLNGKNPGQLLVSDLDAGRPLSRRDYPFEALVLGSKLLGDYAHVPHAAFTADGARVTVWLGDRVGIEEVATGCLLARLPKGLGRPLVFSPDGRLLLAAIWQPRKDQSSAGRSERVCR